MTIGFSVLLLIALVRSGAGTATISAKGIGPLEIGKATRTEMQSFALGPTNFWFTQKGNPPVHFKGELWQYECVGQSKIFGRPCRTLYGITNGHLATVETTSPQFFTSAKTHLWTPLPQARKGRHFRRHVSTSTPSGRAGRSGARTSAYRRPRASSFSLRYQESRPNPRAS